MTQRITEKDLHSRIDYLNKITGNAMEPYNISPAGCDPNPGNYHLDSAYGGHGLARMCESGGITKIIGGFYPKKELYGLITGKEWKDGKLI